MVSILIFVNSDGVVGQGVSIGGQHLSLLLVRRRVHNLVLLVQQLGESDEFEWLNLLTLLRCHAANDIHASLLLNAADLVARFIVLTIGGPVVVAVREGHLRGQRLG